MSGDLSQLHFNCFDDRSLLFNLVDNALLIKVLL